MFQNWALPMILSPRGWLRLLAGLRPHGISMRARNSSLISIVWANQFRLWRDFALSHR